MSRFLLMMAFGLLLSACGGGIGSYEEGIQAQSKVMREMVSVLEGVNDESSAEAAAGKIESLGNELADISSRMMELPRPNAKEMQDIAKMQRAEMQAFQQDAAMQMMKLAQYPVLQDAWMSAMERMQ